MINILIATVAGFLSSVSPASEPSVIVDGVPTARVSYADLNLHSTAGRSHMARRIRSAAEGMCRGGYIETTITGLQTNDCYVAAVSSGMRQMNNIAGL